MAREAKLIIAAENKATADIKSAIRDLTGIDDAAKKVGDTLKSAFTVTAIVAAGKQIAEFGLDCTKAFGDVERSMIQLKASVGGNEASFSRLSSLMTEMARKTTQPKAAIEQLVAELSSLGKSDADVDRITRATVALSNVTGKDLNSAFTLIQGTFSGTSGKLEKLVPELGGLTKEQLAAGGAVDLLNDKFGAISDSMAGGVSQGMTNLKNSVDDLKESIGQGLAPTLERILPQLTEFVNKLSAGVQASATAQSVATDLNKSYRGKGNTYDMASYITDINGMPAQDQIARLQYAQSYLSMPGLKGANTEGLKLIADALKELALIQKQQSGYGASSAPPAAGAGPILGTAGSDTFASLPFQNATWADRAAYLDRMTPEYDRPGYTGAQYGAAFAGDYGTGMSYGTEGTGFGADAPLFKALEPLGQMFESLTGGFGSLFTSLSSVSQILDPISTILSGVFEVIGPLVDQLLAPIVGILKIIGQVMGKTLIPILNILTPVIEALANIFIWFMNKVMVPVGNFVIDIWNGIARVLNWALGWAGVHIAYADHISAVTLSDATAAGSAATSSSGTGSNGAAYTGARNVTFNFYNQGNVVGSGGLTELAHLLANILATEERYA